MMLKFHNELAAPEIRIGVNEFNCIGVLPPHDHPHIYLTTYHSGILGWRAFTARN
jgi:uncharacterized Zn-finger protein